MQAQAQVHTVWVDQDGMKYGMNILVRWLSDIMRHFIHSLMILSLY